MLPKIHLDLNAPDFIANPYPRLAELRETAPIFYDEGWNKVFFTRYEDIAFLLRDRRLSRSILHILSRDELGWPPPNPAQATFDYSQSLRMMDSPPATHARLRGLVAKAFTPRRVEALRGKIERLVNRLLDEVEPAGQMDVVRDFAEPLPVTVIAELLGVPETDRPKLRPWSAAIVKMYELGYTEAQVAAAEQATVEFTACLRALVAERRARPQDDLISALVEVEEQGQMLTEDELIANCILILNAGHEATVNGISLGLLALFRNPDQCERLVREAATPDAPIFKTAVDEMLRYESPLPMFERWVMEDVEYQGVQLKRGTEVGLFYASGNRDALRFERPDVMDVGRTDNQHLTFGLGTHYCLGAPLARLEMQIAFQTLLRRFPTLRPATGAAEFNKGFVIRGLKSLPVALATR